MKIPKSGYSLIAINKRVAGVMRRRKISLWRRISALKSTYFRFILALAAAQVR